MPALSSQEKVGTAGVGSSEGRCAGRCPAPPHPGHFPGLACRKEALRVGLATNQPDGSPDNPAEYSHPAQVMRYLPLAEESGQHLQSRPSAPLTRCPKRNPTANERSSPRGTAGAPALRAQRESPLCLQWRPPGGLGRDWGGAGGNRQGAGTSRPSWAEMELASSGISLSSRESSSRAVRVRRPVCQHHGHPWAARWVFPAGDPGPGQAVGRSGAGVKETQSRSLPFWIGDLKWTRREGGEGSWSLSPSSKFYGEKMQHKKQRTGTGAFWVMDYRFLPQRVCISLLQVIDVKCWE